MAPAANLLGTRRFLIGCMNWQYAVFLESIWETDSIIIFLSAQRPGRLNLLLTCLTLLFFSPLLGQINLCPTPLLPFAIRKKFV